MEDMNSMLETPADEVVLYSDNYGWRIQVSESGVRLKTFDWHVRPSPIDEKESPKPAVFGGMGFRSAEAALEAAVAAFNKKMELGQIKPRE